MTILAIAKFQIGDQVVINDHGKRDGLFRIGYEHGRTYRIVEIIRDFGMCHGAVRDIIKLECENDDWRWDYQFSLADGPW